MRGHLCLFALIDMPWKLRNSKIRLSETTDFRMSLEVIMLNSTINHKLNHMKPIRRTWASASHWTQQDSLLIHQLPTLQTQSPFPDNRILKTVYLVLVTPTQFCAVHYTKTCCILNIPKPPFLQFCSMNCWFPHFTWRWPYKPGGNVSVWQERSPYSGSSKHQHLVTDTWFEQPLRSSSFYFIVKSPHTQCMRDYRRC